MTPVGREHTDRTYVINNKTLTLKEKTQKIDQDQKYMVVTNKKKQNSSARPHLGIYTHHDQTCQN